MEISRVEPGGILSAVIGDFLSSGIGGFWWIFKAGNELRSFVLQLYLHMTVTECSLYVTLYSSPSCG